MSAARIAFVAGRRSVAGLCRPPPCAGRPSEAPVVPPRRPVTLRNTDFEASPAQGRRVVPLRGGARCTTTSTSFQFGLATEPGARGKFLKITRVKPEPWALATQAVPSPR